MKRIMIIGCGGSGKSTLAIRLGQMLSLSVHHLDRLYWRPGWRNMPREEWRALHAELTSTEREWIVDGNFGSTMEERFASADTIIFLDFSTLACLRGVVQRYFQHRGGRRPDMADGCPEKLDLEFLNWILTYRRKQRPKILSRLKELNGTKAVFVLPSRRALREFLERLPDCPEGAPMANSAR